MTAGIVGKQPSINLNHPTEGNKTKTTNNHKVTHGKRQINILQERAIKIIMLKNPTGNPAVTLESTTSHPRNPQDQLTKPAVLA